jgi:hypothetical protein
MFLGLGGMVDGSVGAPRVCSNRATRSPRPGKFVADIAPTGPAGRGTVGIAFVNRGSAEMLHGRATSAAQPDKPAS